VSYKLPPTSTHGMRIVARGSGSSSASGFQDVQVVPSWGAGTLAEADFGVGAEEYGLWNRFLGLMVVLAVSGGFWTGVGFFIAHLLR